MKTMLEPDLQPTLQGETITLRPLEADDYTALYAAAADPAIWAQHPDSGRYREDIFNERFYRGAIKSGSALVVLDRQSEIIIGSSRYYDWAPAKREIAIGYTFLARDYWGRGTNREMKRLMLKHIFPHVDAVWFHIGKDNQRSRRAVEKIGAVLFREEQSEVAGQPFINLHYRLEPSNYLP